LKISVFVAAASLFAMQGMAHAQGSVTLYGVVDSGITYNSNAKGAGQYSLNSGTEQPNRWGVADTEDLGDGLHAIFTLEGGFNVANGAWGRTAPNSAARRLSG
jgi:predicted porin